MKICVDSGAHSLYNLHTKNAKVRDFSFYKTPVFWKFVDEYGQFIKENEDQIDLYVNVDVIGEPQLSWDVQKYLEKTFNIKPLPVYHVNEDLRWLQRYIDEYDYVGIGGLGQRMSTSLWKGGMGDHAFALICDKNRMPKVKIHGFAMTSPALIIEYPWYSVDSTSWMQFGKYGLLVVPKKRRGKFIYDEAPLIISVSTRKKRKSDFSNFDHMPPLQQQWVHEYLESIGLKMGKSILEEIPFSKIGIEFTVSHTEYSEKEIIIESGVCNNVHDRDRANLSYYLALEANIPEWPRPWKIKKAAMTRFPGL